MTTAKIKKMVLAALFAALTCITTMAIPIPSPTNGYIHLGDGFVLISGWLLGPLFGPFAAGVGSMLADILTGYTYYAPGTLVIKALVALCAALLFPVFRRIFKERDIPSLLLSGVLSEIIMVAGYFFYACLILGKGLAAAASIPGNLMQAGAGIIIGVLITGIINKNELLKRNFNG